MPSPLTISPSGDTFVNRWGGTNNYGTAAYLYCITFNSGLNAGCSPHLIFSLANIPASATITNAVLSIYPYAWYENNSNSQTAKIFRITSTWQASSVTYNTQPTFNATALYTSSTVALNTWVDFTITSTIAQMASGGLTNYGFRVETVRTVSNKGWYGRAQEYSDANYRPKLVVTYTEASSYYGILKRYNGSTWVKEPLKYYTGAAWASGKPLKRYDGSEWKLIDTTGV